MLPLVGNLLAALSPPYCLLSLYKLLFIPDTFFNQSRYTFSWGSPDILPMFSKGASLGENQTTKVFTEMYESSFEDFSSKDLSQLDTWVFDRVEAFFDRAASDHDLQLKLRQDKIVLVSCLVSVLRSRTSTKMSLVWQLPSLCVSNFP